MGGRFPVGKGSGRGREEHGGQRRVCVHARGVRVNGGRAVGGENEIGCGEGALPAGPILRAADHGRCKLWANMTD